MAGKRVCAVTGASGYLGSRVAGFFRKQGWEVVEIGRSSARFPFRLGQEIDPGLWSGTHALIHCAYDFRALGWSEIRRVNVEGSLRLLDSARRGGVGRLVFVSSMAAFDGCRSLYGKAKLEIERGALEMGTVVVRPGLIFGEKPGGMVGTLSRILEISPIVPLIGSGREVLYLTNEDDLCKLLLKIAEAPSVNPEVVTAACPEGMAFREILRHLARLRGKKALFLPVPAGLAWLGLKAAEAARLPIGLRSDSVVSLLHQDPHPSFEALLAYGVELRPFRGVTK